MFLSFSIADIIKVPFGYILEWLYNFTSSYGLALILFSLVLKLVLLPLSAKSKKSMMKMSRLSPQLKLLEAEYGEDKEGYQKAMTQLYKDEGVSLGGGCLWSLIPLIIIIPLYQVIREPIQYMLHVSRENSASIVSAVQSAAPGLFDGAQAYYHPLIAASHLGEFTKEVTEVVGHALHSLNFSFLGIDLGQIPSWKIWTYESYDWAHVGLFVTPLLATATQALTMLLSQRMNNSVARNEKGEKDNEAAAVANKTNSMMMLFMPLMSLWFCFIMPAAISIYWIAQSVFSLVQDYFLTLHYRKKYDAEDEVRRQKAKEAALIEAAKERRRAQRRAENPDGITENTSKKKMQQKQKEQAEEAAKQYAAEQARKRGETVENNNHPLSGDPARPYSRGRAYSEEHYQKPEK